MSKTIYIEDLFIEFFDLMSANRGVMQAQDYTAASSFYNQLLMGNQITQNQSSFLLKILSKYKIVCLKFGLDYQEIIKSPQWKKSFRIIDTSKRAYVDRNQEGKLEIYLKFPYSLKDAFDKEIGDEGSFHACRWDHERRLRILDFYRYNLVHINSFLEKYEFEIDESFISALNQTEEVWQQQDSIMPFSVIENDEIILKNTTESAKNYWEDNKTGNYSKDLLLAKSMGYPLLSNKKLNLIEKICSSNENYFWIKNNEDFFSIYKNINDTVSILLDRNTQDVLGWLKNFLAAANSNGISREDIKVCFRDSKESKSTLNQWIHENNLGGKVEGSKILLFLHKPPKWLFKNNIDVKIIVTNSYTPVHDSLTNAWMDSHYCVCYLGNIKPTKQRSQKIVDL